MRQALEVQECLLAVRKATDAEIAGLLANVTAAEQAMRDGDRQQANAENAAFHDLLVQMSHNTVLESMLRPLRSRLAWILRQNDDVEAMCTEHTAIAQAIAARDADRVRELAADHVDSSKRLALELLFRQRES